MKKRSTSINKIPFNAIILSDIHFFHPRTKSPRMLSAIRALVPDVPENEEVDFIIIDGDFFDHLVGLDDSEIVYAIEAIRWLLKIAKKYNIRVRVLEGTPSHDRNQNDLFNVVNTSEDLNVDLVVVKQLSIEYFLEWDINILYLPDEWTHQATLTYDQVKALIHSRGLEKVDLAFVHGGATYQLPGIHSLALHDAALWSDLVTLQVFAGHIHTHSRYLKWTSVGAIERLGHGEEEAKGIIQVKYQDGKEIFFERRINRHAKIYRTLDGKGKEIPELVTLIQSQKDLVPGSALRIEFSPEVTGRIILDILSVEFPEYTFTELSRAKKPSVSVLFEEFKEEKCTITPITPETAHSMIGQFMERKGKSKEEIELAQELLSTLS